MRDRRLVLALGWLIAALIGTLVTDDAVVRSVLGIPALAVIPGWLVFAAVVPGPQRPPGTTVVFSVTLSFCLLALGAVCLDALGVELTGAALAGWSVAVGVVGAAGAALRREDSAPAPPRDLLTRGSSAYVSLGAAVVAGAAAIAAIALADGPRTSSHVTGYTDLSARALHEGSVDVSVTSQETAVTTYVIRVSRGKKVYARRRLVLKPGATWTGRLEVPARVTSARVTLDRVSLPLQAPYRTVIVA